MSSPVNREIKTGLSSALFPIFVFAAVFLVFKGALQNGFVAWDDDEYILSNPFIRSFSLDNLREMVANSNTGNWHPVTWLSHAVDYKFFGLNPVGHHFVGIIFHGLNAVWVYFIFLRLASIAQPRWAGSLPLYLGGMLAALLYGCHPLRVESVVWASERKDLLSAFFILPAFLAYLSYVGAKDSGSGRRWYWFTAVLFILSLMSKPMMVTFPAVLLILDAFPLNRIEDGKRFLRLIWEKIPFFLLSFAFAVIAIVSQRGAGAAVPVEGLALDVRFLNAVRAAIFYIYKTLWPHSLVPLYPYPNGLNLGDPRFLSAFAVLIGLSLFCFWMWKRKRPVWMAAWLYYLGTILPVIGILQVGRQGAADRYTYLPTLSFYLIAGAGAAWLLKKYSATSWAKVSFAAVLAAGGLAIGGLAVITNKQIGVWENTETFAKRVIKVYPNKAPVAHLKLARVYQERGWRDRAKREFLAALKINPYYKSALNDLGLMAIEDGLLDDAESYFRSGIAFRTDDIILTNLGRLFLLKKQRQLAEKYFLEALTLNPGNPEALNNLGMTFFFFGKFEKAEERYKAAIKIRPRFMQAFANLGLLYKKTGRLSQAEAALAQALAYDSDNPDILSALGEVYLLAGLTDRAIKEFKAALKIRPNHASAKAHLKSLAPNDQ